jgi:hypothetical protein
MKLRRPWVIVGNPENRRVTLYQRALSSCDEKPAEVLSYHGLLTGYESIDSIPNGALVRIESPGENFAVEKLLLSAGVAATARENSPFLTKQEIANLDEDHGRILYPRQWYLGYLQSCEQWVDMLQQRPDVTITTSCQDLCVLFDKRLTHQRFATSGLSVPNSLGHVGSWDELEAAMRETSQQRVFVKLANSSSASGVVALSICGDKVSALTSVELDSRGGETRLYNSLKIRCYRTRDEVRRLIDLLAPHHIQVEQWLPKASLGHRVCDLRIVIIAGEPQQMVVRTSRSPLTNLHLGNRRGNLEELLAQIPHKRLESIRDDCRRLSSLFKNTMHLGVDILLTPGCRHHYLLEANAFGDLLPGALHQGRNTYEAEIAAMEHWASRKSAWQ